MLDQRFNCAVRANTFRVVIFALSVGPSFNELSHIFEQSPFLLLAKLAHVFFVLIAKNNKFAILIYAPQFTDFELRHLCRIIFSD